jgi:hypothetical protein
MTQITRVSKTLLFESPLKIDETSLANSTHKLDKLIYHRAMQVTIPEAARLLRVSERTVRRRLRSGELKGSHVSSVGGFAWMIDLPDTVTQGGQEPGQADSLTTGEIAAMKALVSQMEAQIAAQQRQLEKQEEAYHWQLEAKDKQIEQLHVLLQQAQAALPSPAGTRRLWWRFWQRG